MSIENDGVDEYESVEPIIDVKPPRDATAPTIYKFKGELPEAHDFQYKMYDYAQYEVDRLREKRQSDFIPTGKEPSQEKFLTPLYVITAFFAAIMIVGPCLVRKGPNKGIIQACILLTAFCMWIFWFTVYFGQMNPLMGPRLENTTVAWLAYKWVSIAYKWVNL